MKAKLSRGYKKIALLVRLFLENRTLRQDTKMLKLKLIRQKQLIDYLQTEYETNTAEIEFLRSKRDSFARRAVKLKQYLLDQGMEPMKIEEIYK